MDVNEGSTTEDLWTPYKELVSVVEGYLAREGGGAPYAVHTFESVLRRHKQTFLSLLKNPPKNPTNREEIKRGITEGINLPSMGRTLLSKELVDEAIIISDMYNVNEYLAIELLHTAQRQAPRHPGLPRGLIAIILYYDGRNALVKALKELLMAREGVSWSITARPEVITYVTRYVDQLISDGLLGNTMDALKKFSLASELELLQNNRALPPRKHHKKLLATIENTRKQLAGVIFSAAAQRGLNRDILLRLLSDQIQSSQNPSGAVDDISLALHMALLYSLDLSVLHRRDDGEELAKKLPLIQDPTLISVLLDELSAPMNPNQSAQEQDKASSGVRALCQLSLGLALAALKRAPQSVLRASGQEIRNELLDQDEALVDAAIDGKVFEYIDEVLLSNETTCKEEFYQRRLHFLITDFIVLMHSKLMEMRVKADEAVRAVQIYVAEGLAPPAASGPTRTRFDSLLRCVERLYANDPTNLRYDYWVACETQHTHTYRSGGRAATLYKFVRLSGALVGAPLVGGYLRALASLSAPAHTWPLLSAAPPHSSPLSAHHLCHALMTYRDNLRADPTPLSDALHGSSMGASAIVAARPGRLLVRQEEVEALIAALKLLAAVARVDATACVAICENLHWDTVNVLFGLICCQIPLHLKACLCDTLAALGSRPNTCGRVWAALEAAQLVSIDKDRRELHTDLQEIECRLEEYPLTRAFLSLLISLTEAGPVPRTLGAGQRPPGLDPYVLYVLNKVTLPAMHRIYAKKHEKWQVLSLSLKLLVLWLEQYEPCPGDIPAPGETGCAPPGLQVALQLHSDSELLKLTFNIIHEANELLYVVDDVEQKYLQECLISALHLLELGLAVERGLMQVASEPARTLTLIPLSKLILNAEGTAESDHLVNVCLVLQHVATVPEAAAKAIALLRRALSHPAAARHLLHSAAQKQSLAVHLRHGFVECLEAEEWMEGSGADALRSAKEGVVMLMQQLLPTAAPNFTHYLLGYALTEHISRSRLNEPGSAGFPRTCLHSVLDILEQHIATPDTSDREASELVENCYRLLYWLCARPNTSGPVLRLLRSREHFLARHICAHVRLSSASVRTVSARSWVIRACACALAASTAPAAAQRLATTLLDHDALSAQDWSSCLLRRLLEVPVTVAAIHEPRWELLNGEQLRRAVAECDLPTGMSGKRISVTRLHALLARELATVQETAPQRNMLAMEIQKVLDYVTEVNRQRNQAATLTHYYDSWRQLTEILFCVAQQDLLPIETRKTLLLNILQDLLNKIPPAEVLPQIGNLASGTILLLLVNLRHCYILQKRESNLKSAEFETTFFGPSTQIMQSKSLTLKFILQKILNWILVAGGSTQKMRVNLYGALLNYLNIVNLKISPAETDTDVNETYVSRLDSSKAKPNREESVLKSTVIDVINGFGDNLCSIVCSDCIGGGHDVCRMVALSCLETLIEINPQTDWMNTLTNQGYLRSLIDSLLQDDEGLRQTLEPNPKSLRVLYVYESKMALLTKISGTRVGAETVLAQGALTCLANMKVLGSHPDTHTGYGQSDTDFLPSVANRFRQILLPALSLCDALLTTFGTQNHSCVLHVTHFLLSHLDCLDVVLRAAHPDSPEGLLIELEAVTCVIARASDREVFGAAASGSALAPAAPALARVRSLMLALLARFSHVHSARGQVEPLLHYKIICNVLTYARNIMEPESPRSLLRPSLSPADGDEGSAPAVGRVLSILQAAVTRHLELEKLLATAQHHLANLHSMTVEDMKKLLPPESHATGPSEVRSLAAAALSSRVRARRLEARLTRHAVDTALHVTWASLHVSLRSAALSDTTLGKALTPVGALRGAYGDQLSELRKGLIAVFNDRFTEDLLDTAKNQPPSQRGFLEVLLKDIKSMIQFSPL